jgi:hypothetical protein
VAVRFPVLELVTGGLFAAMAWLFGWSSALPAFLMLAAASASLRMGWSISSLYRTRQVSA